MLRPKCLSERLGLLFLAFLRAGLPSGTGFWDGVAWFARITLICVHLAFALPALHRPNIPLLLPSYSAFDDTIAFSTWGWIGVFAALLLWTLPPRVPWGVISAGVSAFYLYFLGAMFMQGAGLVSAVVMYGGFGFLSGLLLMRAMWAWAECQPWFREHVIDRQPYGR